MIADKLRSLMCAADEFFVETFGRKLHNKTQNIDLVGLYVFPEQSYLGIDNPTQMKVELAYMKTMRKLPKSMMPRGSTTHGSKGDVFVDCAGQHWILVKTYRKDDMVKGLNRLVLVLAPYQEAVPA